MGLTYFKRYRMEINLLGRDLSWPTLPSGYRLIPWNESLLSLHAETKFQSFRDEIDANVFPCLGDQAGCQRLMTEISQKAGFLPEATWLASYRMPDAPRDQPCGTVQGIRDHAGLGAIQNLGITPEHRDRGLGTCLLLKALEGFRKVGLNQVHLEVTAENDGAIRLYHRLGFVTVKTVFKVAEAAYS
jgi:ribosomal protein S18 acetylase RimI-like enzyme